MSRHVSRVSRWARHGPHEERSAVGRVYYRAGQWFAEVAYQVAPPEEAGAAAPVPEGRQVWSLGKFKRARNAQIAVEDKARELQRRYGAALTFLTSSGA
ncbi:MAG TPA: hypothetical protein VFE78_33340 [Gemmataceae bacterium]|jgi:hypothetical protein|nr:hypothetical protein [Gemmataceae bacterium]